MTSLIIRFAVRPIYVQDSIFKMSSESSAMTSTNFSNDRLVLRQNVEINSNEYFSREVFFRE